MDSDPRNSEQRNRNRGRRLNGDERNRRLDEGSRNRGGRLNEDEGRYLGEDGRRRNSGRRNLKNKVKGRTDVGYDEYYDLYDSPGYVSEYSDVPGKDYRYYNSRDGIDSESRRRDGIDSESRRRDGFKHGLDNRDGISQDGRRRGGFINGSPYNDDSIGDREYRGRYGDRDRDDDSWMVRGIGRDRLDNNNEDYSYSWDDIRKLPDRRSRGKTTDYYDYMSEDAKAGNIKVNGTTNIGEDKDLEDSPNNLEVEASDTVGINKVVDVNVTLDQNVDKSYDAENFISDLSSTKMAVADKLY